jgi:hypothetical protein
MRWGGEERGGARGKGGGGARVWPVGGGQLGRSCICWSGMAGLWAYHRRANLLLVCEASWGVGPASWELEGTRGNQRTPEEPEDARGHVGEPGGNRRQQGGGFWYYFFYSEEENGWVGMNGGRAGRTSARGL